MTDAPAAPEETHYRATRSFVTLLDTLGCTLLASVYMSDRLVLVSAANGALTIRSHVLSRPMGIAIDARRGRRRIGISTRTRTLVFAEAPQLVADFATAERSCDAVWLPRAVYYSGDIDGHDAAWVGDDLIVANTRFSCLARISDRYGFEPVWRPPWVTALQPEDRCHLNGLAVGPAGVAYVTGLGPGDARGGWREHRLAGGFLLDVASGEMVLDTLCVPHSPRLFEDELFVCNSGQGRVLQVDPRSRTVRSLGELPGFARGLDAMNNVLFVGLSQPRATSNWHMPIAARRDDLICGIAAIERTSGAILGWLSFEDFTEIFDLRVLAGVRAVVIEPPNGASSERYIDLPGRVFMATDPETDASGLPL